jgi:hypothetical protein
MYQDRSTFSGSQSRYTGTQSTSNTRAPSQTWERTFGSNSMGSHTGSHTGSQTGEWSRGILHADIFEETKEWARKLKLFGTEWRVCFPCLLCSQPASRIPEDVRGEHSIALVRDRKTGEWMRRYSRDPKPGESELWQSLVPRACEDHKTQVIEAIKSRNDQGVAECGQFKGDPRDRLEGSVYIFDGYKSVNEYIYGQQQNQFDASVTYSSDLSSYDREDNQSTGTRDIRQIADVLRVVGQKGWGFYKRWRADQSSGESITREEILQLPALEVDPQVLNPKGHHEYKCLFCGNPSHSNSREDGSSFAVWLRMRDSGNWKRPYVPQGKVKEESLAFHLCLDHREYYAGREPDFEDGETRIAIYLRPSAYDVYVLRISDA